MERRKCQKATTRVLYRVSRLLFRAISELNYFWSNFSIFIFGSLILHYMLNVMSFYLKKNLILDKNLGFEFDVIVSLQSNYKMSLQNWSAVKSSKWRGHCMRSLTWSAHIIRRCWRIMLGCSSGWRTCRILSTCSFPSRQWLTSVVHRPTSATSALDLSPPVTRLNRLLVSLIMLLRLLTGADLFLLLGADLSPLFLLSSHLHSPFLSSPSLSFRCKSP